MGYNEMNFKKFDVCDTHIHIVFPETVERTEEILREIIKHFNYKRIGIMALTSGSMHRKTDYVNNLKAIYVKDRINKEKEDTVFVYGNIFHYYDERDTADGYLEQVKNLYEMGVDGIKLLDGKPNVRRKLGRKLCDPIYDKMYAYAEENGIPVKMHVADPPNYWGPKEKMPEFSVRMGWWYGDGSTPSFDEIHEEVYEILCKFPRLKFCAAHCFYMSHDLDALSYFLDTWENTSIDLTPGLSNLLNFTLTPEKSKEFFKKYASRIFFGTDIFNKSLSGPLSKYDMWQSPTTVRRVLEKTPEEAFDNSIGHLVPLNLDDEILREVYIGSHEKLHPHARALDRERVVSEAKYALRALEDRKIPYENDAEYALEIANLQTIIDNFAK